MTTPRLQDGIRAGRCWIGDQLYALFVAYTLGKWSIVIVTASAVTCYICRELRPQTLCLF